MKNVQLSPKFWKCTNQLPAHSFYHYYYIFIGDGVINVDKKEYCDISSPATVKEASCSTFI
jgi:hypothetical protein